MSAPIPQGLPAFLKVLSFVVDPSDTRAMTADVVHDIFDNMWRREASFIQVGYEAPPQIVKPPCREGFVDPELFSSCSNTFVQLEFRLRPSREAAGAAPEDEHSISRPLGAG